MINDGHDLSLDHIRRSQAQPGSLERVVRPDGVYDNRARMCREVWDGGKLTAFMTSNAIDEGLFPNSPSWGFFPDVGSNESSSATAK